MKKASASSQNGNVLFLILIILALFSVLFLLLGQHDSVTRIGNFQKDSISSMSAIQYARSIDQGVKRMQKKKIALKDIEFFAPIDENFNGNTTDNSKSSDAKKQLFFAEGGGVTYYPVDRDAVEKVTKILGKYQNGNWHFLMSRIKGVGTDEPELVAMLYRVKQDICESINQQLIGTKAIPVIYAPSNKIFLGKYRIDGPGINGIPSQCIKADDHYVYYHVLAVQ